MRIKRRAGLFGLVLVLLFVIVGCGKKKETAAPPTPIPETEAAVETAGDVLADGMEGDTDGLTVIADEVAAESGEDAAAKEQGQAAEDVTGQPAADVQDDSTVETAGAESSAAGETDIADPEDSAAGETDIADPEDNTADETDIAGAEDIREDGEYTSKDEVALYLHLYGHLPGNYISKKEAQKLGWSGGSLEDYAPGKSIGGSSFGNYEGLLPAKKGRRYFECDIDYDGGRRNAKRIVYSNDGLIFYTDDHYNSFEQLY